MTYRNLLRVAQIISPVIFAVLLSVVLFATNPSTVGPGGVLLVFILMYALALSSLFVLLHFGINWISRVSIGKREGSGERRIRVGARKAYYIASVVAFIPVLFLAMRSFSELRLTDVVLVLLFVAIAVFYIVKRL